MQAEVMVALFSLFGTLAGTFSGIMASNKVTAYRMEQLEKRVEKHNSIIDRTYKLESEVDVINEKIEVANHRIKDLEEI